MRTGILIIISLILGYLQGLKKKRRKLNKVIQKLEKENDALLQELNDIKKRKRLSQYSSKAYTKGDSLKFEEELTEIVTLTTEQRELAIQSFVFLENYGFRDNEEITINLLMEASSCILHSEEYEDVSVGSILENNTYNYLWKDCAIAIHTFFVLERYIDLSRYLLSYKELHDSMKYVLSEF